MTAQQGGASLATVVLLLLLATALLHAFQQQTGASLHLVADEKQYFQQDALAESALVWATRVEWPVMSATWDCRAEPGSGLRACLSQPGPERFLLRGDTGPATVTHYRWVRWSSSSRLVTWQAHGWLDYCPLSDEGGCEPGVTDE